MISLSTNKCLHSLGIFFFKGKKEWLATAIYQANTFQVVVDGKILSTNKQMKKDPNNPNINVQQVEAILLAFEV